MCKQTYDSDVEFESDAEEMSFFDGEDEIDNFGMSDEEDLGMEDEAPLDDDFCGIVVQKKSEFEGEDQEVIEGSELMPKIGRMVEEANAVLGTSPINCRVLLFQFKWKPDVLFERFCEGNDVAALLKKSKVAPSSGIALPEKKGECGVCFYEAGDIVKFPCGDQICKTCLDIYLDGMIRESGTAFVSCFGYKCTQLIDDAVVKKYCQNRAGYEKVIINSYVMANFQMKWCPAPSCSRVISVNWVPNEWFTQAVECSCGKQFCFNCYGDRHEPVNCYFLRKWMLKQEDDSETLNWISANTKTCPKCRTQIEKNGGCIHMTCRLASCKHEFCWICFADWAGHSYDCRKFQDDANGSRSKAEHELKKFIFYDNLYGVHKKSIKFNEQLHAKVHKACEQIASSGKMTFSELQYLPKAVDSLLKCRSTLMYSYVFAYYLDDNNEKNIFEDNQVDLEKAVEALNGYLEKELLEKEDLNEMRREIMDSSSYLEQRRKVLLRHVKQGEESETWKFLD
ncbi:hypothetical protein L596_010405 [Steinernema carpocapsae]|uniref:RBR-type E3 ubiquitin transferase n=1 Tax=Steinernema carpocapsae TaxID=34508 RepID=A0A4U5PIA3_STECR|nr:hypothetical protein L596_010405 [Steinernema carpocapsae]